ncbi:MAG: HDOD domain-containing protein [Deltaproteobacteria bacterium]|nr:HDOD domain-containing protein [Deltaproteobacteria bacterium]
MYRSVRDELINSAVSLKLSPSFASVAEKLLTMIERDDVSLSEIADLIKCDLGMATKIISIANSAYYSRGNPILSLNQAILTIGLNEVKNIIVCMVFLNNILRGTKLKEDDLIFMWTHSLFVACCARLLSKRLLIDDPEKVFTVSLFHDIGKLVFFMNIDWYRENIEEAIKKKIPLIDIESERYGVSHTEIGSILAKKWKFPDIFGYVIKNHCITWDGYGDPSQVSLIGLINASNTFYYFKDIPDLPYGYILKNEHQIIEEEVEKFIELINSRKKGDYED